MEDVVIQSYGVGNAPDARDDLISLFKEASKRGVLILNITQCHRGAVSTSYVTGKVSKQFVHKVGWSKSTGFTVH